MNLEELIGRKMIWCFIIISVIQTFQTILCTLILFPIFLVFWNIFIIFSFGINFKLLRNRIRFGRTFHAILILLHHVIKQNIRIDFEVLQFIPNILRWFGYNRILLGQVWIDHIMHFWWSWTLHYTFTLVSDCCLVFCTMRISLEI